MLLCLENTASTADSTQNKMILYHLSENLCLQQRRKEEGGRLQKQQMRDLQRYLDDSNKVGTALCHCIRLSTASSPEEMAHMYHRSLVTTVPGDAHQGAEQTRAAEGVSQTSLPTPAKTAYSSTGCWQLSGLPATGSRSVFLKEKLWQK